MPNPESTDRPLPLTKEIVRVQLAKTYNAEGKPDWSHIFPYYHPDIVFRDSIQRIEGIDAFRAMCGRLTRRCRQLRMDLHHVTQESNVILFDWTMTMVFRRSPSTPIHGCTRLTLDPDGRMNPGRVL